MYTGGTCVVGTWCVIVDVWLCQFPWPSSGVFCPIGSGGTDVFGRPVCVCSIPVLCDEAGHTWCCPAVSGDVFDALFVATSNPPDLASFSAFFLALQFSVECLPFPQKVHLVRCSCYGTEFSAMVLTFTFFAGDSFATSACWVSVLSIFPAGASMLLLRLWRR